MVSHEVTSSTTLSDEQLLAYVHTMALEGVARLETVGTGPADISQWADEALVNGAKNMPVPSLETLPPGLSDTVSRIGELLAAHCIRFDVDEKEPHKSGEDLKSHIDTLSGPCVASLVIPISGPEAIFAMSQDHFVYPFDVAPQGVRTFTYGVGQAALVRERAFNGRSSAEETIRTLNCLPHAGWHEEQPRVLAFANFFSSKAYDLSDGKVSPFNLRILTKK